MAAQAAHPSPLRQAVWATECLSQWRGSVSKQKDGQTRCPNRGVRQPAPASPELCPEPRVPTSRWSAVPPRGQQQGPVEMSCLAASLPVAGSVPRPWG